jgi:hypothetical protein
MSDIETAKPGDGLVDQGANVIFLADVGVDELGLRTQRAQLLSERLAGLITPTGNDQLRAPLGEGHGGGATNAGQGASDQYYLVAHPLILANLLPCRQSMERHYWPRPFFAVSQALASAIKAM